MSSTVTITTPDPTEAMATETVEADGEASALSDAAIEDVSDATVQIAAINADRDVEIARLAHRAASADTDERLERCEATLTAIQAQMAELSARLIPPPSTEPEPPNPLPASEPLEATGEGAIAVLEQEVPPPAEPPAKKRKAKHRWI